MNGNEVLVFGGIAIVACAFMLTYNLIRYNASGSNKLFTAIKCGNGKAVTEALKNGVDPNSKNFWGSQPALHAAVISGNEEITRLLLDAGANANFLRPDQRSTEGDWPCSHCGMKFKSTDELSNHLEMQHKPNAPLSPLVLAYNSGHMHIFKLLLERGVNPNCLSVESSPRIPLLYCAAEKADIAAVELLLQHGAQDDFAWHHDPKYGLGQYTMKLLVKELCDSKNPQRCDICGNIQNGMVRDFIVCKIESSETSFSQSTIGLARYVSPVLSEKDRERYLSHEVREARCTNSSFASSGVVNTYEVVGNGAVFVCHGCIKADASEPHKSESGAKDTCLYKAATEKLGKTYALGTREDGNWTITTCVMALREWHALEQKLKAWVKNS